MEMLDERRSKILFSVALGKRASKFGASVHTPEADEYVNAAWLAFLASGLPMPEVSWVKVVPGLVADWIDQCLEHDFVSVGTEVPPVISASGNLVKSVFEKENGLEEAVFRRADHRFFTAGGSRHTGQGTVSATWFQ